MSATETTQGQHADPPATCTEILAALERAGWQLDADEPHLIEASDGERYGVAVFLEGGVPVEICYGDGEQDLQHSESWAEAPCILGPTEVARMFGDEGPPEWPRISPEEAARRLGGDPGDAQEYAETCGPSEVEIGGQTYTAWPDEREEQR